MSHASVLIETRSVRLWTDPWLSGKAFNDSWALWPEPVFEPRWLDGITHLWISHEHPDHFHVPTLRSLPAEFRSRVQVLFQANNSDKVASALRAFGYPNFRSLPNRASVELGPGAEVYCYGVGNMDSALGFRSEGRSVLNLNDAECSDRDCAIMRREFGRPDLVLNQFSLAGYSGEVRRDEILRPRAAAIIDNMLANHRALGAAATLPFASFVYFCCEDNAYMNGYANTIAAVRERFERAGASLAVLYPGDVLDVAAAQQHDSSSALARFAALDRERAALPLDTPAGVGPDELERAFHGICARLHERYPTSLLRLLLDPVVIHVPDLGLRLRLDFARDRFAPLDGEADADLTVRSQPLHFALSNPYGVQTLGVSARYALHRGARNWLRHRVLFAMHNAEIYLRPGQLFSRANLRFARERSWRMLGQLAHKLRRHRVLDQSGR